MASLSVIMPALNEEENIKNAINDVLRSFIHFSLDGEIIVINDGSNDSTEKIAKDCAAEGNVIKIITHDTPRGIGASFRDGVRAAKKESVVMIPGDAENEAYEIVRYIKLMDDVDIINPYVINKSKRGWLRGFISSLFLTVINFSFNVRLNYTNGTVVYRRSVLNEITNRENGFFYQVEALIKLINKGYIFAEVPYNLALRESGRSKAVSLKSLYDVIKGYLLLIKDIYFTGLYKNIGVFVSDSKTYQRRQAEDSRINI